MKNLSIVISLISALLITGTSMASSVEEGKAKAAVCLACHGMDGIGTQPMFPNINGQKVDYLIKQLKAFRDGTRKDLIMYPMSTTLTDADIDNLAAYYSSLK